MKKKKKKKLVDYDYQRINKKLARVYNIIGVISKISPLNAIMRKNLYFGLMKIYTHDIFIKAQ
jgi:hypothetical protein